MLEKIFTQALEETGFQQKVEEELDRELKSRKNLAIDAGAILAIVLPILIKAFMEYVLPWLLEKGIPMLIEWLKKQGENKVKEWFKSRLKIFPKF